AQCFHNSCSGLGWQDFKKKIGLPSPQHYDPPLPEGKKKETRTSVRPESTASGARPCIAITTEEHEVNEQAVKALTRDRTIYQRAGRLVRVVRDDSPATKGIRRPFAPRIEPLPPPLLRERLAANAQWTSIRRSADGEVEVAAHPPAWSVSAVHARS